MTFVYIGIIIVVNILTIVLVSYFKKKGENIATKEDIAEITRKIESVKNEISFVKLRENEFLNERKFHIISLLEIAYSFQTLTTRVHLAFNNLVNNNCICELQRDVIEKGETLNREYVMVIIYGVDEKFDEISKLYHIVVDLHNYLLRTVIQLDYLSGNRCYYFEKLEKSPKLIDKIEEIDKEVKKMCRNFEKEIKHHKTKLSDEISSYIALINVLYKLNFHQKIKFMNTQS
ncbi:MAG: hypothetical protein LBI82_11040 [Dysgonamonadaceae bacterium]|jgi:uncharacterized protein YdcH (DUF465 family)|nr:hypothetical protein [Dysgonamonadaceae bacterium]